MVSYFHLQLRSRQGFSFLFYRTFICWVKGSYNNWKEKKTHQITIEEIQDFLAQVDFENMVREYAEGLHDNDPIPETDPYIEFEIPCAGYDCALSPQREDACRPEYRTERNGKVYCKVKLNLNKLVRLKRQAHLQKQFLKCRTKM